METKRPNWTECSSVNVKPDTIIKGGDSFSAFIGDIEVRLIILMTLPEDNFEATILFFEPSIEPHPENLKTGEHVFINRSNICWKWEIQMAKESYTIYITDEAANHLNGIDGIPLYETAQGKVILCDTIDESIHFLKVFISDESTLSDVDYDFALLIPYHFVIFCTSGAFPSANKIQGFAGNESKACDKNKTGQ